MFYFESLTFRMSKIRAKLLITANNSNLEGVPATLKVYKYAIYEWCTLYWLFYISVLKTTFSNNDILKVKLIR